MENKKKKKTSRQKAALVLSLLLALVIVVGATFAWFTSSDEVTNKLSASNSYGVSITESFTPPDQWIPGESIKKEVSVINTGNIAAFVKVELSNAIELTVYDETSIKPGDTGSSGIDYVELSADEVIALQAGGLFVSVNGGLVSEDEQKIDTSSIVAETVKKTGTYIFLRTTTDANGTTTNTYVGYFALQDANGDFTYYKLANFVEKTDADGAFAGVKNITYQYKKTVTNPVLTFDYSHIEETTPYIVATYDPDYEPPTAGANYTDTATANNIIINIYLKSVIKLTSDNYSSTYKNYAWTFDDKNSDETTAIFYYNEVLEAGGETEELVTAVELDKTVTNEAYASFDYSLIVNMNSVQVTALEDGTVTAESANAQKWSLIIKEVKARIDSESKIIPYETETTEYTNEVQWENSTESASE